MCDCCEREEVDHLYGRIVMCPVAWEADDADWQRRLKLTIELLVEQLEDARSTRKRG